MEPRRHFIIPLLASALLGLAPAQAAPEAVTPHTIAAMVAIDWNKGPVQKITGGCGKIRLDNLKDGETYSLWIAGTESGFCSFSADGLTFRYPSNYGPTTPGQSTLFSFARFGTDVLVSWVPGY